MSLGNSFFSDFGSSGGKDGAQGVQGVQGAQGLQGNRGIQGILGNRGGLGSQGVQGFDGQIGSQGVQGIQGAGSQGSQGVQGIKSDYYQIIPLAVGQTTDNGNGIASTDTAILTTTPNIIFVTPTIFRQSFNSNLFSIRNVTAVAGRLGRILIYSNGTSGVNQDFPETKLFESVNIDLSTTGIKSVIVNFNFFSNTFYWIGFYANLSGDIAALSGTGASLFMALGLNNNQLRQSATYGSAPTTWNVATQTYAADTGVRLGMYVNSLL